MTALPAIRRLPSFLVPVSALAADREFAALLPPAAADQAAQQSDLLAAGALPEPLVVWPCAGRLVLLTGYDCLPLLRRRGQPVPVVERPCADRAEAWMYVLRHHLARHYPGPLAASYLRGLRYARLRHPPGGDRRSPAARRGAAPGKTAEALAEVFHVSTKTIRRDGALAAAVESIAGHCGEDARGLLLAREGALSRAGVLALAQLPPAQQQAVLAGWRRQGRPPHGWRQAGSLVWLVFSGDIAALAAAVLRRLGPAQASELHAALGGLLGYASGGSPPAPTPPHRLRPEDPSPLRDSIL